jgi:CheY-like chemotaxis protein
MTQRDVGRVLVVDDNLDNAESLSLLVEVMGHEGATAHDGEEAIEVAKRRPEDSDRWCGDRTAAR